MEVGKKIVDKINDVLEKVNVCLDEEERVNFYINLKKISDSLDEISNKLS